MKKRIGQVLSRITNRYWLRTRKLIVLTTALTGAACGDAGYSDGTASPDQGHEPTASVEQGLVQCAPGATLSCPPPPPGSGAKITCFCVHPPPQTGSLVPEFFITHVVYAPPGRSSNVNYSASTSMGTTTSVSKGFKTDVKITAEASGLFGIGSASLSGGVNASNNKTDATDISVTYAQGYRVPGQADFIDHNYDEIHVLIRPKLDFTYQGPALVGEQPVIRWKFGQQDGLTFGIPVKLYAGWLNSPLSMPGTVRSQLDYFQITPDKYGKLLAADPLFTGTFPNMTMDPARYEYVGAFPYTPPFAQGDQPSTQSFSIDRRLTTTHTLSLDENYSVGLVVGTGLDFGTVKGKLSVSNTWTWTNSSTWRTSDGAASIDGFTVGQPTFGYSGPTLLRVYVDKIYHTYAFTLDYPQGETNLAVGRTSFQSSELLGYGATASKVNDGNTDGNFWNGSVNHTEWGFTHGFPGADGQWWFVDLGSEKVVNSVKIFNRTDCCTERLSHYKLFAWDTQQGWKVVSDHSTDDTNGVGFFNWPIKMVKTQYVGIAKTDENYLHLAEVEVLGF